MQDPRMSAAIYSKQGVVFGLTITTDYLHVGSRPELIDSDSPKFDSPGCETTASRFIGACCILSRFSSSEY
jgi:hypothetical protein